MKILSLLINLVPYHVARWSAVATMPGWDVDILQVRAEDDFKVLETQGGDHPFKVHTLGIQGKTASPRILLERAGDFITRLAPDVVVISGYSFPMSLAMLSAAKARRIPVVVCSESNKDDFRRRWLTELVKGRVVRQCAAGFAGGKPQKAYLCDLGMTNEQVFTGYNSVDNEHFSRGADLARIRAEELRQGLKLPKRYWIAVARFTEKKNLAGLIDAYGAFVSASVPDAPALVIAGDGPLREALEAQIRLLQLDDLVHFPGPVGYDDLPAYYGLADAFIHASSTEQWGLVVNEAMAAGLPVLVSNRCGCVSDLVKDRENGLAFAPDSAPQMADSFAWLNGLDESSLKRMGNASRRIVDGWSPRAFAQGLTAACGLASKGRTRRMGLIDKVVLKLLMSREERA